MREFRELALITVLVVSACGDDSGTAPGPDPIVGINVLAGSDVIVVGRSLELEVTARTAGGVRVDVPAADWESTDPDVADVDATGIVTGLGEGTAVITATAEGHEATLALRVAPDSLPIFTVAPFEGTRGVSNPFDHDVPVWSGTPGQILTWRGSSVPGLEGHDGYDWPMPPGTPLVAVADGLVGFAGSETPWSCPLLNNEMVSAAFVVLLHTAPGGERFLSLYVHLDRLDVKNGDEVVAGQPIGTSGNSGCSTGPHLHFEIRREFYHRSPSPGQTVVTDPNGWAGSQHDPWLLDSRGAPSTHLWAAGAEPSFTPTSRAVGPGAVSGPPTPPLHIHRLVVPPLPPRPGDIGR